MRSLMLSLFLPLLLLTCGSVSVDTSAALSKKSKQEIPIFKGTVMRSLDQGKTWESFDANLRPGLEVNSAQSAGGHLYITDQSRVLSTVADGKAQGWNLEQLFQSWLTQEGVGALSVSNIFSTPTRLFAFLPKDGLYWRPLQGGQWKRMPMLNGISNMQALTELSTGEIFIGTNHGIYSTADEGKTWEPRMKGRFVISLLHSGTTLYAGCSGGLFQSVNSGKDWTKVELAIDRDPADKTHSDYLISQYGSQWLLRRVDAHRDGNQPGRFQLSADGGKTWKVHPADQVLRQYKHLPEVLEMDGKMIIVEREGIKVSEDGGKTWNQMLRHDAGAQKTSLQLLESNGIWYAVAVRLGC